MNALGPQVETTITAVGLLLPVGTIVADIGEFELAVDGTEVCLEVEDKDGAEV
jgi:hypothetical protein